MFQRGFSGVLLFFMISGYCITISAAGSKSEREFYAKRLGRLLPALVLCSFVTVVLKHLWPSLVEPGRFASWRDLIACWISIPTGGLFGIDYTPPDGAYWSLIIEFQFYALVAAVMALGLRGYLLQGICIFVLARLAFVQGQRTDLDFYPFFIAGVSIASLTGGQTIEGIAGLIFAVALEQCFQVGRFQEPAAPIEPFRSYVLWGGILALLVAVRTAPPPYLRKVLLPLSYIGLVSYPIYLLHQDAGHLLLRLIGIPYSDVPYDRFMAALIITAVFVPTAGLVYAFVERPLIRPLTGMLSGLRHR